MTKEQIKFLKSVFASEYKSKPLAFSTTAILNDHNVLNTMKDLVAWDDEHQLIIGVKVNEDQQSQTIAPVKVVTCSYDQIFFLDSIYSTENFEIAVDKLFGFLSADLRNQIKNWARNLPIHGNKVERPVPYYGKEIDIPQNLDTPGMRSITPIIYLSTTSNLQKQFDELEVDNPNCEIVLKDDTISPLRDPLTINKSATYIGTRSRIVGRVVVNAENVTFKNVVFSGTRTSLLNSYGSMIEIGNTCKSITFDCCYFGNDNVEYDAIISAKGPIKMVVKNCEFNPIKSKDAISVNTLKNGSCISGNILFGTYSFCHIRINGIESDSVVDVLSNKWNYAYNAIYLGDCAGATNSTINIKNNIWRNSSAAKDGGFLCIFRNGGESFDYKIALRSNFGPGCGGNADQLFYTKENNDIVDFSKELNIVKE